MAEGGDHPHSAPYLGAERDLWWNADYVDLLARRFDLRRATTVLDVGAGLGHWGALLLGVLSPDATIIGLERDPRWVTEATARARSRGLAARLRYEQGVAEKLPYPDGSFDLVTCQTLLIHVADPSAVIAEMVRVVRARGLVLVAEPNNRAQLLVETNVSVSIDVDRKVETIRFALMLERGKQLLGEGYSSLGDLVPGLLSAAGLEAIQTYVADKAARLTPPYDSDEQQVLKRAWIDAVKDGFWLIERASAERYFAAAGGDAAEFDTLWRRRLEEERAAAEALEANSLHSAGGVIHYVVGGWKPGRRGAAAP